MKSITANYFLLTAILLCSSGVMSNASNINTKHGSTDSVITTPFFNCEENIVISSSNKTETAKNSSKIKNTCIDVRGTSSLKRIVSSRDNEPKLFANFDGENGFASGPQIFSSVEEVTIMCWIKTGTNSETAFIVGQDNFNITVNGITGIISANANEISVPSFTSAGINQWIHVTAVFDGNSTENLSLYINGKLEHTASNPSLGSPLSNGSDFTMARSPNQNSQFFKGAIDEVRVFNKALSTNEIQKMVYQEIESNSGAIRGTTIPKDIEGTLWSSLTAYYKMDIYSDDVVENSIQPSLDGSTDNQMRIYNVVDFGLQEAPMPFVTTQSGKLENALNQNMLVNGQETWKSPWAIIEVKHNVTLQSNLTSLGLIVDTGATIKLQNNNVIKNTWYLKLDGMMDLQGKSQLLQLEGSELDASSAGYIERDQQGTVNPFNYNYWCSPVGVINETVNNADFTVGQVLRDGTNPNNPLTINWLTGVNSVASSPISLSSYWIFKYQNVASYFSNWSNVGENGQLAAAQGFTLKGSNVNSPFQNYTFIGKPNNGNIEVPIASNNLNLTGNPYPSALDATAFITENLSSTTGIIYFWEHFDTNTTHNLQDYQGGYATRSLVGGTPAVSPATISGVGTSDRIPGRFIPVGQGFFMTGSATGGMLKFRNSQRTFIREENDNSGILFRTNNATVAAPETDIEINNEEDIYVADNYARVRLGFNSDNNYHRQILLGFMDDKATSGIDRGYDAAHIDTQTNDMYFMKGNVKMNILGESYYNENAIFPLGVKTNQPGIVQFIVDDLTNFAPYQRIFIYDNVTATFHNITNERFEIFLPAGNVNDRFSLRFTDGTELSTSHVTIYNGITVTTNKNDVIAIQNLVPTSKIQNVTVINMIGQTVGFWSTANLDQENIQLSSEYLSAGTYIIKMNTTTGDLSKKIVIR